MTATGSPRSTAVPAFLLLAAVGLYVGLAVASLRTQSATFDEGAHLPAGYTYLTLGDHRLNPEQPPLVKLLAAAPLLALHPVLKTDDLAWATARQWEFGKRFLYRWNDGARLVFWGRLPIVALGALLSVAVFLWARFHFGFAAAALALLLCVLSPDVLAHGQLVTTDLGLALFFFLTVIAFERLLTRTTPLRLLLAGLALGAAVATKFSAPILLPVLLALGLLVVLGREPVVSALGGGERRIEGRAARAWHVAFCLVVVGALALGVLWASYGFHSALSPDPAVRAAGLDLLEAPDRGVLGSAAAGAARFGLVPEDYARGLLFVMKNSAARSTFLMGELSDHGFPSYFLYTFALKTPLPLVALLLLSALARPRLSWRQAGFLWLPVLVYVAFTFTRGLQIGHRHLLPLYPFLFVAAGRAATLVSPARLAVPVLAGWYAVGTLAVHPHYLAYFNELGGGPRSGYLRLVDSNLDWGQDLPGLRDWMRARGLTRIKLSYFGSADPAYYDIDADYLPGYMAPHPVRVIREVRPGDIVAVSATNLQGVYLDPEDRPLMERFRRLAPIDQVGHSILIFRSDFSWP